MLLIVASILSAWTAVALLVVGCCVSAAQGDHHGWYGNASSGPRAKLLRGGRASAKLRDRAHHAA